MDCMRCGDYAAKDDDECGRCAYVRDRRAAMHADRDAEAARWNAVLAAGEGLEEIESVRDEILVSVHTRIMNDDDNYRKGGWTPTN